jgi:hypothetical protein
VVSEGMFTVANTHQCILNFCNGNLEKKYVDCECACFFACEFVLSFFLPSRE